MAWVRWEGQGPSIWAHAPGGGEPRVLAAGNSCLAVHLVLRSSDGSGQGCPPLSKDALTLQDPAHYQVLALSAHSLSREGLGEVCIQCVVRSTFEVPVGCGCIDKPPWVSHSVSTGGKVSCLWAVMEVQ